MITDTIIKLRTLLSGETVSTASLAEALGELKPHGYDSDILIIDSDDPAIKRFEVNLDPESGEPETVELVPSPGCELTLCDLERHFGAYQEREIDDAEEEECAEFDFDVADAPFRTRLLVEYDSFDIDLDREVLMSLLVMREERL